MKNQKSKLLQLTAGLMLGSSIFAGDSSQSWYNGIYLSASGGGQVRGRAAESSATWTDWDPGSMANISLGYHISRYVRAEIEGSMFHNNAETLSAGPGLVAPAEGSAIMRAVFVNLFFEYPIKDTKFKPYFGGGVGTYKSYLQDLSNTTVKPFGFVFDGESTGERFAYQLRAGLSYALTDHLDIWGGYRFFDGDEINFKFADVPIGSGATFTAGPKDAKIHGAEMGIRWTF